MFLQVLLQILRTDEFPTAFVALLALLSRMALRMLPQVLRVDEPPPALVALVALSPGMGHFVIAQIVLVLVGLFARPALEPVPFVFPFVLQVVRSGSVRFFANFAFVARPFVSSLVVLEGGEVFVGFVADGAFVGFVFGVDFEVDSESFREGEGFRAVGTFVREGGVQMLLRVFF